MLTGAIDDRPVVGREIPHARVGAVPEVVAAGDDLGHPVDARSVLHFPLRAVRGAPRPAEGIAQAQHVDQVRRGQRRRTRRRTGCPSAPCRRGSMRRILPRTEFMSSAGVVKSPSPMCTYSLPSGPKETLEIWCDAPSGSVGKSSTVVWLAAVRPPSVLWSRMTRGKCDVRHGRDRLDGRDEHVAARPARRRCPSGPSRPSPESRRSDRS